MENKLKIASLLAGISLAAACGPSNVPLHPDDAASLPRISNDAAPAFRPNDALCPDIAGEYYRAPQDKNGRAFCSKLDG